MTNLSTDTTFQITATNNSEQFQTLAQEWNELLNRSTNNIIFNTIEWHENWWASYHPGELWLLTVRDESSVLRGIASFFIANSDGNRTVHFVGCEDVTDYLDLIVDEASANDVYNAIAQYLAQNTDKFDSIDLCNIPESSPTRSHFITALENAGFSVTSDVMEVCPIITLDGSWDDYLANIDKKQRHEIRRKLRKADGQKSMEVLDWYIVSDEHDLQAEMQKFLTLMATSQQDKATFLEDEAHQDFFNRIVPALYEKGWVQLAFLTMNDTPVTAYLNFDYGNKILVYNSGLDASEYGFLSPGIVLLSYNIQHAIDNQREVFDFLRGDETYKYRMGGKDSHIYNIKATLNQ